MTARSTEIPSLFCSYVREDEIHRKALERSLAQLRREGRVADWYDRKILPGAEWDEAIKQQIERARVILFLISRDLIDSEYVWRTEVALALEQRARNKAIVIPIIVRPADWRSTPFGSLQALPRDGKPVTKWTNRDEAWMDVANGIRSVLAKIA